MNKQYINKLTNYFEITDKNKINYLIETKLKKFKIGRKKRFFIKYKYPHRRSNSHYKSYVTLKRYLIKNKLWYTAKKKCLNYKNFEKLFFLENFSEYDEIYCNYGEE